MHTLTIKLDSIDKVKEFVRIITAFDNDFDLRSGRYTVDAKSILGIFSLDLSKPIELDVFGKDNLDEVVYVALPVIEHTTSKSRACVQVVLTNQLEQFLA